MQLALVDQRFSSRENMENWLAQWIGSNEVTFVKENIRKLPER